MYKSLMVYLFLFVLVLMSVQSQAAPVVEVSATTSAVTATVSTAVQPKKTDSRVSTVAAEDPYAKYISQVPDLIDCQQIKIDERDIGGLRHNLPTVCFYKVDVANVTYIMWHELNSSRYGFVK